MDQTTTDLLVALKELAAIAEEAMGSANAAGDGWDIDAMLANARAAIAKAEER